MQKLFHKFIHNTITMGNSQANYVTSTVTQNYIEVKKISDRKTLIATTIHDWLYTVQVNQQVIANLVIKKFNLANTQLIIQKPSNGSIGAVKNFLRDIQINQYNLFQLIQGYPVKSYNTINKIQAKNNIQKSNPIVIFTKVPAVGSITTGLLQWLKVIQHNQRILSCILKTKYSSLSTPSNNIKEYKFSPTAAPSPFSIDLKESVQIIQQNQRVLFLQLSQINNNYY